jgi:EmrB/QacA subfamily drug resistance transporter
MTWVTTVYLMTSTIGLPIYGKLGDLFGRKGLIIFAIAVFLIGSALSGISQNMTELIIFRGLQGAGAGGLMIGAQSIIGDIVTPRERGKYMGLIGSMFGVATVAGPLVGGWLTDSVSWRWVFYVNIPIGVIALAVVIVALHVKPRHEKHKLDFLGMLLLAATSACIVLFSTWGGTTYAWGSWEVITVGAAAVVLAVLFLWNEKYASEPIIPLHLFRNRAFNLASLIGVFVGVAMFGSLGYLGFFLQMVDNASATTSGLLMLPFVAGMLISSIGSGRIVSATGRYKLFPIFGTAIACVGLVLLSRMSVTTTRVENGIFMFVMGFGIGLVMQILILIVQNGASPRDLGASTAAANYFRQIGATVGSGIVGSVFASRLLDKLKATLPPSVLAHGSTGGSQALTPKMLDAMPPQLKHIFVEAYAYALPPIFLYLVPVLAVGFVLSFFVKEIRLRTTMGEANSAAEQASAASAIAPAEPAAALVTAPAAANGFVNGSAVPAAVTTVPAAVNGFAAEPVDGQPVSGRVLRAGGQPLAGATVTLIGASGRQAGRAVSGADGSYLMGVAEAGAYTLIAMSPGHQPFATSVRAGTRPAEVDVHLTGASRLTGIVRAATDGSPLPEVTLTMADSRGEVVATTVTSDKGQYGIDNLVAGTYTLAVSALSWQPTALAIQIADGEETAQDITLRSGAKVTGTTKNGVGLSIPDARVTLLDPEGNVHAIATTGSDGAYSFENVGDGDYTVIATGYPPAASRLKVEAGETHSHDIVLTHPED